MTWKEIEEALKEKPVVLVPLGSVEQHGPHTPVGDYLASEAIAKRVAERTDSLYIPTLPYGYSEVHRGFPGTLTYRPSTLRASLEDLTECLFEVGVDHVLFLCGHGGNVPIIEHYARDLMRMGQKRTACIDIWRLFDAAFYRDLYGMQSPKTGHGSEPIGSVMAYLTPEATRPDLLEPPGTSMFGGLPAAGSQVTLDGKSFHVYPTSKDTSKVGVIGDPSLASAEHGEKIVAHVVDLCCDFVEWFKKMDTATSRA